MTPTERATAPPAPRTTRAVKAVFAAAVLAFAAQFAFKTYRTEPYPTLLMPGGAEQYHEDPDGLAYRVDEFYAVGADGRSVPFRFGDAFPSLPPWYWDRLKDFGLDRIGPHRVSVGVGPLQVPAPSGVTTEAEAEATRAEVRRRVEALVGFTVDSVRVRRVRYRTRYDTGETERLGVDGAATRSLRPHTSFEAVR